MKYIVTKSFTVNRGGEKVTYVGGSTVIKEDFSKGVFAGLLDGKWIALEIKEVEMGVIADVDDPESTVNSESTGGEETSQSDGTIAVAGDWMTKPVTVLEIEQRAIDIYVQAGLVTIQQLAQYGKDNGSLTGIDGIGAATETKTQEAIKKIHEASVIE